MRSLAYYLIPDLICETVYEIPYGKFRAQGARILVFDIDNTLAPYSVARPDQVLQKFLFSLRGQGWEVFLVSNNSPERVALFNESLGFPAFPDAKKPSKKALAFVFSRGDVKPEEVLMIGDQLLTDVFSAKRWGARAAVVSPIEKKESLFFRCKRALEKPFVRAYYRKKKKEKKEL